MTVFYHLGLLLYAVLVRIIAPFNHKARLFVKGRKRLFKRLNEAIPAGSQIVWFHCASLGEFEQGRPIMEAFRRAHPECKILLTFFSPSGYEVRKHYSGADWVFYLPLDTPRNVRRFLNAVNPAMAVFIKYEFWRNYLCQLRKRRIPTYIIAAIFLPSQPFFKWYGAFFRKMLKAYTCLFVQNEASAALLKTIGITNVEVAGDPRFDRVVEIASQAKDLPLIDAFCAGQPTIVAGSTWRADEEKLEDALTDNCFSGVKLVLVPHEVNEEHITQLEKLYADFKPLRYTQVQASDKEKLAAAPVLIVDTVGVLSSIYRYASVTYIGGGFGAAGIHNVLESAVYGVPTIFGPVFHQFQEGVDLVNLGGALAFSTTEELKTLLSSLLFDKKRQQAVGDICKKYVQQHTGATEKIIKQLLPSLTD